LPKVLVTDTQGGLVAKTQFPGHDTVAVRPPKGSPLGRFNKLLQGAPPTIAIIRSRGGIGDVLMTTPTIKGIKKTYPNCHITYGTDPLYLNGALMKVLDGNKYIDSLVDFHDIKAEDFDVVINLTCPCTAHEVPGAQPINRIDLFARHAGLTIPLSDPGMDYEVKEEERNWARDWLDYRRLSGKKLVLVQVNSSTTRRDLPQIVLQKALVKVLTTVKNSRGIVILHSDNVSDVDWTLEGVTQLKNQDVRHIAALVECSNLVLCPDSSVLHLASALRKNTVTFFGPTDPRARVNYHPEAVAVWGAYDLKCKNCWWSQCRSNFACWSKISSDMVAEPAICMLQNNPVVTRPWLINYSNLNGPSSAVFEVL